MLTAKLCGVWYLVGCSNPTMLGSTMVVDYNNVKFTHNIKKNSLFSLRKNTFGTVRFSNSTHAKVVWSNRMEYSVESSFLPRIPIPWKLTCPRFTIDFVLDDTGNELVVKKSKEMYKFRKQYVLLENNDHFYKIFMTQILFEFILRHLHF